MKAVRSIGVTMLPLLLSLAPTILHASVNQKIGLSVVNFRTFGGQMYLNLIHGISLGSSSQGWAGTLSSTGYPSSTTPSFTGNNLHLIPTYYGHYKVWWSGTGGLQIQLPLIIYSGGTATALNTASGFGNQPVLGYNGATTQPSSGNPIELAFGSSLGAVSDAGTGACGAAGGTAGLVCLTSTTAGIFGNLGSSGTVKVNFVNNLPSRVWTYSALDNSHIQLQGSTYEAAMSVNRGLPGTQSEAIFGVSSATWVFPAQGSLRANYSGFGNMVLCRSQNTGIGGYDDCTEILNTRHQANPDYAAAIKQLNPRFVRFMDLSGVVTANANTSTNYTYRPAISNLSWGPNHVRAYLSGSLTNAADAFTVSNPSASPANGAYQDGEVVIGQVGPSGANTTYTPTLQISGRTGAVAAPILSPTGAQKNVYITGPIPLARSTVTMTFAGGGLGPSGRTLTYTVQSRDTSAAALCSHLLSAVNADTTLSAAHISAVNYDFAFPKSGTFGSASNGGQCQGTTAALNLAYNSNINTSGSASLGNGMTLSISDNSGQGTTYGIGPLYPGALVNGQYYSFTWSQQLQGWVANNFSSFGEGMFDGPPLEFYEDLCLQANVGLWLNVGMYWNQNYITQAVTNIANSGVKELAIEFGNEVWNSGEGNWAQANHLGQSVGLTSDPQNSWYGLRVALISQTAKAAWVAAGRSASSIFMVNAYQFVNLSQANRWNGGTLNPGSNVTLAAFGNWGATSLSTNYSASPNRPIDLSDLVSGAPYWQGAQLNQANNGMITGGATLSEYNGLLLAAYNYAYGTPTLQSAALDFFYNTSTQRGDLYDGFDAYAGSTSALASCTYTPGFWAVGSGKSCAGYFNIGASVAAYDAGRATAGLSVLGVANYEGDFQSGPVNTNQQSQTVSSLNTLGYTNGYSSSLSGAASGATCASTCPTGASDTATVAAANIAALLLAFKNDGRFQALYTKQLADERAAAVTGGNRTSLAGSYGLENADVWAKYSGNTIYSTPFQSWYALQALDN